MTPILCYVRRYSTQKISELATELTLQKMEQKSLKSEIEKGFERMEVEQKSIRSDINSIRSDINIVLERMENFQRESNNRFNRMEGALAGIASGLGLNFEKFNAAWIKKFISEKYRLNEETIEITFGRKEKDSRLEVLTVTGEIEIDIWISRPFVVGEATSFLKKSEFPKLEKLAKLGPFLERRYGEKPQLFFFTFSIDPALKQKATLFAGQHNITLITQME